MKDQKSRFARRYIVDQKTGCWLWHGHMAPDGYGRVRLGPSKVHAHRAVYMEYKGHIPDGLQIDHLCCVRNCVNPEHLEAVTSRVNGLRSASFAAKNARKTHCKNGHPLSGENLALAKDGSRHCRICDRKKVMRWHYRNREPQLRKMRARYAEQRERVSA